jgi:hypothetical protein
VQAREPTPKDDTLFATNSGSLTARLGDFVPTEAAPTIMFEQITEGHVLGTIDFAGRSVLVRVPDLQEDLAVLA